MPISAAIFDMDGLLINSERISLAVFLRCCEAHNLGEQTPLYMALLGTNKQTTETILQQHIGTQVNVVAFIQQWSEMYNIETTSPIPLMPGVTELLDYLDNNHIPTAVATSTNTQNATLKLQKTGIFSRFQFLIGGDQVHRGKPAPDIYLKAAKQIQIDPSDCLAMEDSPNGVKSAMAAGMQVIQVPDLKQPDNELRSLGHVILSSLHDVPNWLSARIS